MATLQKPLTYRSDFLLAYNEHKKSHDSIVALRFFYLKVENETRQSNCATCSCLPVQTALEVTCGFEVQVCGSDFECDDIWGLLSDMLHVDLQEARWQHILPTLHQPEYFTSDVSHRTMAIVKKWSCEFLLILYEEKVTNDKRSLFLIKRASLNLTPRHSSWYTMTVIWAKQFMHWRRKDSYLVSGFWYVRKWLV